MRDIQTKLNYVDMIADWFLEIGETHDLNGDLESRLKYIYVAASLLYRQNRTLSNPRVESNLQFVAGCLTENNDSRAVTLHNVCQKEICLHVINQALPAGGLTAMMVRWMENDRSGRTHSVALLSQKLPIPDAVYQAVSNTGGSIYKANPTELLLNKAAWLKKLANNIAKYIILHIDVDDVICGAAFGTQGGPPVLLVNHSAHIFWTEGSVADLIVNCRGSALEGLWTATHRGFSRYATVPIPLLEPKSMPCGRISATEVKHQAKQIIGIPTDSILILTVGASFKYLPVDGLDFIEVCESILEQLPEAYLLTVGFEADSRWRAASRRVGLRIRALGTIPHSQLAIIHDAADIYIEGFPFGTTTALLEAGLKGIPAVLSPAQCPPPYGSDGVALDDTLERPRTIEEFKTKVIQLSRNSVERTFLGDKLREAVTRHHTGSGWQQYLEDAIKMLPLEHSVYTSITPVRTPEAIHEYWSTFWGKWGTCYEESLEHAFEIAYKIELRPRVTLAFLRTCREYRSVRNHRTIPLPILYFLCNFLIPVFPITWARNVFRIFSFMFRASLLSRVRRRIIRLFGGTGGRQSWYAEYHKVSDRKDLFRG